MKKYKCSNELNKDLLEEIVNQYTFILGRVSMLKRYQNLYLSVLFLLLFLPFCVHAAKQNTVVATINTGVNPSGIAITSDNRTAYIANVNNYAITDEYTVSVLNLDKNTVKKTITDPNFNEPYTVTIDPDGEKAYVTNSNGSTISIISTKTNKVIGLIPGFDGPSGMVIIPNGKRAYVNNYGGPQGLGGGNGKTISVVDLKTNMIVDTIEVGLGPVSLILSPDGKFVYVLNYENGIPGSGTMSIIQTKNNQVIDTIPGLFGPFDLAITPNGKYIYVTNFGSNDFDPIGTTVSVINVKKRAITDTIDLSLQPSGIAIDPKGRFAYVTNYNSLYRHKNFVELTAGQGTVSIIDIKTNKVIPPTIAVGESPDRLAISSNGKFAYVSNFTGNALDVIALPQTLRRSDRSEVCRWKKRQ